MSNQRNVSRLKEYVLGISSEFRDELPASVQDRVDSLIVRGRKIVKKLNAGKTEKAPSGREYIRRHLIGSARSVTGFLDGNLVPQKQRTPQRSRPKRVVKRKE